MFLLVLNDSIISLHSYMHNRSRHLCLVLEPWTHPKVFWWLIRVPDSRAPQSWKPTLKLDASISATPCCTRWALIRSRIAQAFSLRRFLCHIYPDIMVPMQQRGNTRRGIKWLAFQLSNCCFGLRRRWPWSLRRHAFPHLHANDLSCTFEHCRYRRTRLFQRKQLT